MEYYILLQETIIKNDKIMKKYLLFMLAFLPMVFASCSSDDDVINSPIVGTWTTSNMTETTEISFNSNGTAIENSTLKRNGAMREYVGSYSVNNDKLTINWKKYKDFNSVTREWTEYITSKETVIITFKINGNKLTFVSMEGEEENNPVTYTRK